MISRIRSFTKKQVALAVAAMSIVGVVGAVSVTQAAPGKPTKEQCSQAGFENYGECVRLWAQGTGYSGSGSSIRTVSEFREQKETVTWRSSWFSW